MASSSGSIYLVIHCAVGIMDILCGFHHCLCSRPLSPRSLSTFASQSWRELESELLSTEVPIPVYFAHEDKALRTVYEETDLAAVQESNTSVARSRPLGVVGWFACAGSSRVLNVYNYIPYNGNFRHG